MHAALIVLTVFCCWFFVSFTVEETDQANSRMSTKVLNNETSASASPGINTSNGKFIETIDPDDPEYRRDLQRPADVKEDMRQMESRQRVSSILNSQAFREELESIIADQLKHGPHPSSLIALQQISDLLLPNTNSRWQQVNSMAKCNTHSLTLSLTHTHTTQLLATSTARCLCIHTLTHFHNHTHTLTRILFCCFALSACLLACLLMLCFASRSFVVLCLSSQLAIRKSVTHLILLLF